jgi:formylglycine-generating enzyme required for sulfatase activity
MCAGAGKRLPTSDEWYRIALGTETDTCVVDENAVRETGTVECVSSSGIHDMVGNVWEWVDATVVGKNYDDRELPPEGYVTSVDASGVAITTATEGDILYGDDYFWSKGEGVFGMIRGGFYGSDDDAGLYAVNASVPTSFASQGVGFRCVEDVS